MRKFGILVAALRRPSPHGSGFRASRLLTPEYDAKKHVKLTGVVDDGVVDQPAHARLHRRHRPRRQGDQLEHGAHEPEYDPPPGLGSRPISRPATR
mgnify:CR=1 FL=1